MRIEKVRQAVGGRQVVFELTRDGTDSWRASHAGTALGTAYKLTGGKWKARPPGRPAPVKAYDTRALALAALWESAA